MEYEDCVILRSLNLPKDRIHSTMVTCGNIYRFSLFAKYGTNYREFGEFSCYKAAEIEVDGELLLLICHGVSNTSTAPILRELIEMGVKVVIRTGSCGTYKPEINKGGDICIIYACIRKDTSSYSEVDIRYPAVADYDVIDCLVDTSKKLGINSFLGIDNSTDLFTDDIAKVGANKYPSNGTADIEENETSVLYVLSSLYGVKSAAVCTICSQSQWMMSRRNSNSPRNSTFYSARLLSNYEIYAEGCRRMVELALVSASQMNKKIYQTKLCKI